MGDSKRVVAAMMELSEAIAEQISPGLCEAKAELLAGEVGKEIDALKATIAAQARELAEAVERAGELAKTAGDLRTAMVALKAELQNYRECANGESKRADTLAATVERVKALRDQWGKADKASPSSLLRTLAACSIDLDAALAPVGESGAPWECRCSHGPGVHRAGIGKPTMGRSCKVCDCSEYRPNTPPSVPTRDGGASLDASGVEVADTVRCSFYLGNVQCDEAEGHEGSHMLGGVRGVIDEFKTAREAVIPARFPATSGDSPRQRARHKFVGYMHLPCEKCGFYDMDYEVHFPKDFSVLIGPDEHEARCVIGATGAAAPAWDGVERRVKQTETYGGLHVRFTDRLYNAKATLHANTRGLGGGGK